MAERRKCLLVQQILHSRWLYLFLHEFMSRASRAPSRILTKHTDAVDNAVFVQLGYPHRRKFCNYAAM